MSWTTDQLQTGLFASLGVTVVVLGAAIYAAHKSKVKAHISLIGVFLVVFAVTVYFAEMLGLRFDFENHPHISHKIHLTFAVLTGLGTLGPLSTGFQHWRGKVARKTHKVVALVWGVGVVLALLTGFWMLKNSTLKAEFGGPTPAGIAPVQSD